MSTTFYQKLKESVFGQYPLTIPYKNKGPFIVHMSSLDLFLTNNVGVWKQYDHIFFPQGSECSTSNLNDISSSASSEIISQDDVREPVDEDEAHGSEQNLKKQSLDKSSIEKQLIGIKN